MRGRQLEVRANGHFEEALKKFDQYFLKVKDPQKSVLVEYADLYTSQQDLDKAIEIFNHLLENEYDYEIALKRAKHLLWKGELDFAVSEFKRLAQEKSDNFESRLFLGDSYLYLQDYSNAKSTYNRLLKDCSDPNQKNLINFP